MVLLGETHDDSIAHQLQLQLMLGALKQVRRCAGNPVLGTPCSMYTIMHHVVEALIWTRRAGRQLTLSLEMFERDVQGVMDEYLAGSITERDLRQVRCL